MNSEGPGFWMSLLMCSAAVFGTLAAGFTLWALWSFARTLRHRHRAIRALFVMTFTFVILAGGALAMWTYWNARSVHREIVRARSAGEPLTFAELRGTPSEAASRAGNDYRTVFNLFSKASTMEAKPDAVLGPLWVYSIAEAYREWLAGRSPSPPTDEQIDQARRVLHDNRAAFEQLDRAAEKQSVYLSWESELRGFGAQVPSLDDIIFLAEVGWLRTLVALAEGDSDAAVASVHSQVRMLRIFRTEPFLIHYLVRTAIAALIAGDVATMIESGRLSEAQLRQLMRDVAAMDDPEGIVAALVAERVYICEAMGLGNPASVQTIGAYHGSTSWATKNAMLASLMKYHGQAIDAARQGWPDLLGQLARIKPGSFVAQLAPSFTGVVMLIGRTLVDGRAARLAIACELYRREHGELPGALDELVPQFIEEVPADPFDGRPLRYKRQGDTVLIYSVHQNRTDDGGVIEAQGADPPDWGVRLRLGGAGAGG
jgi:hypothetical protein